ncbi:MAG: T9SS type A sorting domain-containing protein, partial [Bacteroidales bacterium]|nr:T9SS type A sorting domain-containing protein [Bacteroidales bacterium]
DTAQEATITWTNPTKTLGNQNITSIDHMVVERNGVIIYISEATTPGATMSFVDNTVPCYSTFEYRVYAVCNDARGKYAATTESFGPTCSWKIIGTTTSMTGWKGGAIVSYDGAGSKIDECTMTNNNPMTYNMNITLGKAVFMWKAGTDNVALTIKIKDPADNVVYQYDGNSNDLPEGVILETNNGCGNAAPTEVPGELFTSEDGENIILTWSGSSKTMYGYNIYRDGYLIELAHDTEFVDVAPSMGGHCYQVCYLTDGGESVLSNEACATAGEGCDAPTNIWYQVQNNYKPLITWDPAPNMTPDDAYVVYRKTGDDGEYTLIKYVSGKTEYKENKALTDGTWYYYRVMASYNDSGCESAPAKSKYANEYYVKYYYSTDGVEEIVAQNVNVYPNPTKDILTVEAVNLSNVVIYNSLGQRVFAQTFDGNEAKIDMSSFDAGIYMVRISADGNEVTKKISVVK